MLPLISWTQYFAYMGLALLIYYACIIVRFYRKEILHIKLPKTFNKITNLSNQATFFSGTLPSEPEKTDQNSMFSVVHDCVAELKSLMKQSAIQQSDKSALIIAISKLLQKYPMLKRSLFQVDITHLIAAEIENNCNIRLSADELASVWA